MKIIYADSMFLLNFTIDYLLLLATGKICSLPLIRWRMALGAAWGGLYAVLTVVWPAFLTLASVKILAGAAAAAIAYCGLGRFARTAVVFFAVSAAFGGAVYAALSLGGLPLSGGPVVGVSLRTLVLSFALCYAALSLVFRGIGRRGEREIMQAEVTLRNRSVSFAALRDTGNELRDAGGRPVIAAEWEVLRPLFPDAPPMHAADSAEMLLSLSALEGMAGRCRLLSCTTVAGNDGLLLVFRPDKAVIDGKALPLSCAVITAGQLSPEGDYHALC